MISSNLNTLIKLLYKHYLHIVAIKTIYLNQTNISEINNNIEYLHLN